MTADQIVEIFNTFGIGELTLRFYYHKDAMDVKRDIEANGYLCEMEKKKIVNQFYIYFLKIKKQQL